MIFKGTNCKCTNCNREWNITYADILRHCNDVSSTGKDALKNSLSDIADIYVPGNIIKTEEAEHTEELAKLTDEEIKNLDFVIGVRCPNCKNLEIKKTKFMYEGDELGEFKNYVNEEHIETKINKINAEVKHLEKWNLKLFGTIVLAAVALVLTLYYLV